MWDAVLCALVAGWMWPRTRRGLWTTSEHLMSGLILGDDRRRRAMYVEADIMSSPTTQCLTMQNHVIRIREQCLGSLQELAVYPVNHNTPATACSCSCGWADRMVLQNGYWQVFSSRFLTVAGLLVASWYGTCPGGNNAHTPTTDTIHQSRAADGG